MNSRAWTDSDFRRALELQGGGWSPAEIGKLLDRSENAVRVKLISKGFSSRTRERPAGAAPNPPPPEEKPAAVPSREEAIDLVERRDQRLADRRARQEAIEEVLEDRLLDAFRECVSESLVTINVEPPVLDRPMANPCSAVLAFGDTHFGKVVDPNETESRVKYDPAVSVARMHQLEREVIRLVSQGPVVEELVVFLLGDIVEGALSHHNEREETLLISKQFALAVALLVQFLSRLSAVVPKMRIYGVSGNHGRWPGQRKMPTVGRSSNLDTLVYSAVQMVTEAFGLEHIKWDLRESSRQQVRIQETLVQILHGDELRGGEFCIGGLRKEVFNSVLRGSESGGIPDLWVLGDKHVSLNLPMGSGNCIINGSMVGEDVFGQRFSPTVASQTLFWVCAERGRFLQSEIRLDAACLEGRLPYDLSTPLTELIARYQ